MNRGVGGHGRAGVNIEYLYAFIGTTSEDALVIFKVEDVEEAARVFAERDVQFLDAKYTPCKVFAAFL